MRAPLVSVIVTNYNYAAYIREALDSVANQTYENLELIIINDGSTDDSDKIVKDWIRGNSQFAVKTRYVLQKNHGIVFARNKGLELANGEYLIFLDADDYFENGYIKNFVEFAIKNDADAVYGDPHMFSDDGKIDKKTIFPDFSIETLKAVNIMNISSLIKTEVAKKTKFDTYLNRRFLEDWDFFLGLALVGAKIVHLKKNYLHYRIKPDSRNITEIAEYKKVYNYIVSKYTKRFPKKFEDIKENWERERELSLQDARVYHANLNATITYQNEQLNKKNEIIGERDRRIAEILNSRSYKLSRILASPIRRIKGIFKK